jgi:hypothetical protein
VRLAPRFVRGAGVGEPAGEGRVSCDRQEFFLFLLGENDIGFRYL